nr:hypothetical protein [Sphingomonas sp. CDS-1]
MDPVLPRSDAESSEDRAGANLYGYDLEEEKRRWFARWEQEVLTIARRASVAELLEAPDDRMDGGDHHKALVSSQA